MDNTLRRVFLSDLHLESAETRVFSAFVNLLQRESQRANEIYLLGDLVEMWVGDDDDSHYECSQCDDPCHHDSLQ